MALEVARPGDVIWRLDRMGRSLRNLIDLVGKLDRKQIALKSLQEAIIALPALSALAEEENAPGDVYLEQPDGGAINARTGEYYPPAGPDGVIDAETGEFYPKAGPDGYINPATGQYHPAQ